MEVDRPIDIRVGVDGVADLQDRSDREPFDQLSFTTIYGDPEIDRDLGGQLDGREGLNLFLGGLASLNDHLLDKPKRRQGFGVADDLKPVIPAGRQDRVCAPAQIVGAA